MIEIQYFCNIMHHKTQMYIVYFYSNTDSDEVFIRIYLILLYLIWYNSNSCIEINNLSANMINSNMLVNHFHFALSLWCDQNNISRDQYIRLQEILHLIHSTENIISLLQKSEILKQNMQKYVKLISLWQHQLSVKMNIMSSLSEHVKLKQENII